MLLKSATDPSDGSSCVLTFDEVNQWLRATWKGFVDTGEATKGADSYLTSMQTFSCPYLLNDNSQLVGPWFDSIEWLQRIWGPQASRLGLRYVAHVTHRLRSELAVLDKHHPFQDQFEVQLFETVAAAEDWLRSCQKR
ncbi:MULTISPECIES: hypothetical protein [Hymenobacter]|uniref:STAS/SEC14 domain-containing protein n=2 Tax=Hymenobacter TaxID=89966 RepID=A0ABS6X4A4_9BACT|nr:MULTISPECIES: hypothetical protein [Hymenobacter]MBO3269473.1 hypothetical protein [Hymenobacter defluvii]MBW3130668.1 hypothetical protein [Hymenobacter profundi]QNE39146.1 hypothetical protein F1C16_06045 [Hymenobacter sp. NBH84]